MKKLGPLTSKKERVVYWQIVGTNDKRQTVVEFWQKDRRSDSIKTSLYDTNQLSRHVEDITGLKAFRLERI
jgi:hypothetical protein